MSRASTSSQRVLTLTEELEKLEQSITLTLQEIDHNFSRAHRIVTTSILPVVEQYAEHSKNVWEGSKFWKQFFEASANVSLSGYEETPPDDETVTEADTTTATATTSSSSTYPSPNPHNDLTASTPDAHPQQHTYNPTSPTNDETTSPFSSPATQSTPRAPPHQQPSLAAYSSPYEALRQKITGAVPPPRGPSPSPSPSDLPSTPRNALHPISSATTPQSSPFLPPSTTARNHHKNTTTASARTPANDPLLHRVLDKNYRLQATPHTQARRPSRAAPTPRTAARGPRGQEHEHGHGQRHYVLEELDSSPLAAPPEVRAELFTPAKGRGRGRRVPGVSVLTPRGKMEVGKRGMRMGMGIEGGKGGGRGKGKEKEEIGWDTDSDGDEGEDDDDDDDGMPEGMSPPKTMQFYIPQRRLLRTPAREASKRIVEGLLRTAGGGDLTDELDGVRVGMGEGAGDRDGDGESSPSVVGRGGLLEEDTF